MTVLGFYAPAGWFFSSNLDHHAEVGYHELEQCVAFPDERTSGHGPMTITLDLPEEVIRELSAEADRLGLPLAGYIERVLATGRTVEGRPQTGAELVDYWRSEGLIGSRPDIADSQQHARQLRARAEQRSKG